jgi:hypothetical protein
MVKTLEPLADAYAKLAWSDVHIKALIAAITRVDESVTPPAATEDASAHPYDGLFRPLSAEIPTRLAFIVADAIHNMRIALDYLMSALAAANGNADMQPTFPVCQDEEHLRKHRSIKAVSKMARGFIERQQPYLTGCDRLWWLHRLDIIDKHRKLSLLEHGPPEAVFLTTNPSTGAGDWYMVPNYWIEEPSGAPRLSVVILLEEMLSCATLVVDAAKEEFFTT